MKLLLNESQIREIAIYENLVDSLNESLSNGFDFDGIKKKIKKAIGAGVAISVILSAIAKLNIPNEEKMELENEVRTEMNIPFDEKLVDDLECCINGYLVRQRHNLSDLKFDTNHLLDICKRTGFDLPLLLAQMQCESNFGLNGTRCAKTNSPFSVGLYDNGRNIVTYASQDDAIDSYIRIMQNDYLTNGKSVNDLLKDGCFVNKNGHRYAQDPNYEQKIRATRNAIIKKYPSLKRIW